MNNNLNLNNIIDGMAPPDFAGASPIISTMNNKLDNIAQGVSDISQGVSDTLDKLDQGVKLQKKSLLYYILKIFLFIIQNIFPIAILLLIVLIYHYGKIAYDWLESVYNSIKSFLSFKTMLELENQNMKKEKEELAEKLSQTQQKLRQLQFNPGLV